MGGKSILVSAFPNSRKNIELIREGAFYSFIFHTQICLGSQQVGEGAGAVHH